MALRDIYLCIGGNLGDRNSNMEEVLTFIEFNFGTIVSSSPIVESAGWQMIDVPPFLNQIVHIQSELSNKQLIDEIHDLDDFYGRPKKGDTYLSREMDLDILLIGEEIIEEPELIVPHPRMLERRFVLLPFSLLAPDLVHPQCKQTIAQLLDACPDNNLVQVKMP
jgi:2-amino-4-hydroxy-6-hydroxymethyldihydropteridine diphosphokinase